MSKLKEQGNKKKSGKGKKNKRKNGFNLNQREKVALAGFVGLILIVVLILSLSDSDTSSTENIYAAKKDEPEFVKEGRLFFIEDETGDTLKTIAIEIADNNQERARGLMYRSKMADSVGMLFIFDRAREQSFWMKNTILTLDILYAGADGELLTIYKYTIPYSESPIPSFEKAKYVVEVIGGFTDRYKIERGDKISFVREE